jgi:hypothetical protein
LVTGIRVEDVLSSHLDFVSHTLATSLFVGQTYVSGTRTLTLTGISLAPGQVQTFDLLTTLNQDYQSGTVISNTARIHMPLGRENREIITIFDPRTNNQIIATGALVPFAMYDLLMTPLNQYAVS